MAGLSAGRGEKEEEDVNKVIKGRRYDTDTAEWLGGTQKGYPGDFEHWEESLYRKRSGEFFLHGTGGAASKYREQTGQNEWTEGEKIIPLDISEAQEWAEKYLDADRYEEIFGAAQEDGERTSFRVQLTPGEIKRLKEYALERRITPGEVVGKLIRSL